MARETKVGLIVGLGVILFVSVFVSDYLSDSSMDEDLANQLPDFNQQTNNQTPVRIEAAEETPTPDSSSLYAASLERVEERFGPAPVVDRGYESITSTPPPRGGNPIPRGTVADVTPPAGTAYTPGSTPIGARGIDDRNLAIENQLPRERVGPTIGVPEEIVRVEIPTITPRPRQVLHTVESGENLSMIARKHYNGDGNMWRSIRDANPGKVGPNGEIRQGISLVIPKRSTEPADPAAELSAVEVANGNTRTRVRMITVQAGDSLSEIAAEHLGSAGSWKKIMAVNPELEKPEHITPGMKLRIPVDEPPSTTERPAVGSTNTPANSNNKTYKVKAGDNLYRIAAKTLGDGERFKEIFEANRNKLSSANDIRPGMVLKIPN